jgi:hypothetical protein
VCKLALRECARSEIPLGDAYLQRQIMHIRRQRKAYIHIFVHSAHNMHKMYAKCSSPLCKSSSLYPSKSAHQGFSGGHVALRVGLLQLVAVFHTRHHFTSAPYLFIGASGVQQLRPVNVLSNTRPHLGFHSGCIHSNFNVTVGI